MNLPLGISLGIVIAFLAWRAGALSPSGAVAAALTGGMIFGLGGWGWAVLLLAFFISSSALSRLFRKRKAALDEKFAKGSTRDWGQVVANGGLGALLAAAHAVFPEAAWPWVAFAGAMAAVNGDTWATELGVFSRAAPRLITSGRQVERGTSGGVSALGYAAVIGGALLVGLLALIWTVPGEALVTLLAVVMGGAGGVDTQFSAGGYRAGNLPLPALPERDRTPPAASVWHTDLPAARLGLVEQRLG